MYKRIDEGQEKIEGFSYHNKHGDVEGIKLEDEYAEFIRRANDTGYQGTMSAIYYEDIPNLIKALQAAYDYHKGNK